MPTLAPLFRYFTDISTRSKSENIRLGSGSGYRSKTNRSSHNHPLNFGAGHARVFPTETKITAQGNTASRSDNDSQELIIQRNKFDEDFIMKETEYSVRVSTAVVDPENLPIQHPHEETKTPGLAR
jgi:hypothetical protein